MIRFLLVRHATPSSGGADPLLSETGVAESRGLAARLAGARIDAAWTSDLGRATMTADAILSSHPWLEAHVSSLLREVELPADGPSPIQAPDEYRAWEWDALARLDGRLQAWMKDVEDALSGVHGSEQESHPTVLVVSHAGTLRVLLCRLLSMPVGRHWSFRLDRASLTTVDWTPELATLVLLNDRCHLTGDSEAPSRRH